MGQRRRVHLSQYLVCDLVLRPLDTALRDPLVQRLSMIALQRYQAKEKGRLASKNI